MVGKDNHRLQDGGMGWGRVSTISVTFFFLKRNMTQTEKC